MQHKLHIYNDAISKASDNLPLIALKNETNNNN